MVVDAAGGELSVVPLTEVFAELVVEGRDSTRGTLLRTLGAALFLLVVLVERVAVEVVVVGEDVSTGSVGKRPTGFARRNEPRGLTSVLLLFLVPLAFSAIKRCWATGGVGRSAFDENGVRVLPGLLVGEAGIAAAGGVDLGPDAT